jgi:hypothetical protein
MKQFNNMINEASERLSRDFEVGVNVLSKQTKNWLKELDTAAEKYGLSYDKCREAAKQFKTGDFESALKTIWGNKLEVDTMKSENGGNIVVKTYTVGDYAVFTEKIEYKNGSFVHAITGSYTETPTPGYSLGTVIAISGKGEPAEIELIDDRKTREALAARNTANIYNILFVGCDIHSKFLSKPMLKLKNRL